MRSFLKYFLLIICFTFNVESLLWASEGVSPSTKSNALPGHLEKGKLLFEELEDDSALVGSNVDLGYCYLELKGQVDKSLGYFKCANEISKKNNHKNIGLILGDLGIGLYYTFVGNYNKGDYYFKKSIENPSFTEANVLGRTTHDLRRQGCQLFSRFLKHAVQRRPSDNQSPAGAGAHSVGEQGRVSVDHPNLGGLDAQLVSGHLGEGCLVALTVG